MTEYHKLDNEHQVFFYEQDYYVLSNFSAFQIWWAGMTFPTAEHLYHWLKFRSNSAGSNFVTDALADMIQRAPSAHEAFRLAREFDKYKNPQWDIERVPFMKQILQAKVIQHEYVRRKLLATGHRELIEDSWRDDFWGWGPNKNGTNMLGKLWMEVRTEIAEQER